MESTRELLLGRKGRWSLEVDVRKTVGRPGSASHCSCPISLELLLHKVGHILIFTVGGHDLKILSILRPPLTTEPPSRSTSGAKEGPIQHLLRCGKSTATFILWEGQSGLLDRRKFFSKQNSSSPFKYSFMVLGCEALCQPRKDKPANMMQRVAGAIPQQKILTLWMLDGGDALCEMDGLGSDVSKVAVILGDPVRTTNRST
jgi:hypothetical protein